MASSSRKSKVEFENENKRYFIYNNDIIIIMIIITIKLLFCLFFLLSTIYLPLNQTYNVQFSFLNLSTASDLLQSYGVSAPTRVYIFWEYIDIFEGSLILIFFGF